MNRICTKAVAVGLLLACVVSGATLIAAWDRVSLASTSEKNVPSFFEGPIVFEPNQGQADRTVKYVARGPGYVLRLTENGSVMAAPMSLSRKSVSSSFEVKLLKTSPAMRLVGLGSLPSKSSYYIGTDRSKWLTGISNFAEVQFRDAYPGIHVICHGTHGSLRYEFRVEPGAKPELIAIEFVGNERLRVMDDGRLFTGADNRQLRLSPPTAHQDVGGSRHLIPVRYTVRDRTVAFAVGNYDRSRVLVIDPVINYSKYLRNAVRISGEIG